MNGQTLDGLARRVLLDAARLDGPPDAPHTFSPAFEKKMRRLCRRADHPVRYRLVQAAACLLLAALLSGCSILAFVPEARAAFAGWMRELRREWSSYHFAGEAEAGPKNTVYRPVWLPEGYREITAPRLGTFVHAVYENEEGARLSYAYQVALKGVAFHIEGEGAEHRRTAVAGARADLYQSPERGGSVLVWTDAEKGIVFWLAGALEEEELLRVAESIRESPPMDWVYRLTWFPPGSWFVSSTEEHGQGETVLETPQGVSARFCYSKTGRTPYDGRTDGRNVILDGGPGLLYPAEEPDTGQALTWRDNRTGYAFWLVSELPWEELLRTAESVEIYLHSMSSVFTIDTFDSETDPLRPEVEQVLTEAFVERVRECAREDAEAGEYMSERYYEVQNRAMEQIAPERESAEAHVSALLESLSGAEKVNNQHILCLVDPFYFANIFASSYNTTAHIYNEDGVMIAGYNRAGWFPAPTLEEMQLQYTVTQIYYTAYQEARKALANTE